MTKMSTRSSWVDTWLLADHSVPSIDHSSTCQDTVRTVQHDNGSVLLCVADGAGGSEYALKASRCAVTIAVETFLAAQPLPTPTSTTLARWLRTLFEDCGRAFIAWVQERGGNINDFSTTLALVVLCGDWIGLASVGDSFVLTMDENAGLQILQEPMRPSRTQTSSTYMLADYADHTVYKPYWAPRLQGVLLSSDGLDNFLQYRTAQDLSGARRQVAFGVNPFLNSLLNDYILTCDPSILDRVNVPAIRTTKRDDIGVAVAARQPS